MNDATLPASTVCRSALYADELGRQACRPCTDRTDRTDRDCSPSPGPTACTPVSAAGSCPAAGTGGPSVSGRRTAPLAPRLELLSLMARGGVVTILQTWLIYWHELLGFTYPRWQGERPPRRVPVACPCGQALRVTLDSPWARCSGCGTQYGHSELMVLPLAERRTAAA
ncbi:hypothetical protein ACWCP6_27685 [Streptomyces sp. NPDC002004]